MTDETTPKTVSSDEYNKVVERAQKFEAKLTDLERNLERYKGIDPEAYKAMKEDYDNLRKETAAGDKGKIEQLVADKEKEITQRFSAKLGEYEGLTKQQSAELKKLKVTNVAMQKAANLFTSDSLKFIEREVEGACDWDKDGIVVKGSDGKPLPSTKDPRQNMGVDEFLESLAEQHPSIAKSNASGGSATAGVTKSTTSAAGAKGITLDQYEKMSNAERAKLPPQDRMNLMQQFLRK